MTDTLIAESQSIRGLSFEELSAFTARAAAVGAASVVNLVGSGDKMAIDRAAVSALETHFDNFRGRVMAVSCEGIKDEAPHLQHGEVYGRGSNLTHEMASDPVEGTTDTSNGDRGGFSLVAIAKGSGVIMPWSGVRYAEKLAGPEELMHGVSLDWRLDNPRSFTLGVTSTIERIARNARINPFDVTVMALQRQRNAHVFLGADMVGADIVTIDSGDFAAVELASGSDPKKPIIYMGSGGTPEGTLSSLVSPNGFQMVLAPQDEEEMALTKDPRQVAYQFAGGVLTRQNIIASDMAVLASGSITGGKHGMDYRPVDIVGSQAHVDVRVFGLQNGEYTSQQSTLVVPHSRI